MSAIGQIAGPAGDQLSRLEAKQAEAQARSRAAKIRLRDARSQADALDAEALDVEAGVLAGVATKASLTRTRKALDTAVADAGPDAEREAKVAARAAELVDAELAEFIRGNVDELLAGLRDQGAELEERLRSHLHAALATIGAYATHEGQLMRLLTAGGLGTRGVRTASDTQRDLRRALRAALDNGQTRPARFQSDALTSSLIPPPDEDE